MTGPFAAALQRRGTPADFLVLGLGNPGAEYAKTRHNAGADCVAALAKRHGSKMTFQKKERANVAEITIGGRRVVLAFPQTFYNLVGEAAVLLIKRHGVEDPANVIVVHDELDLPIGRLKLKLGGGLAGNNGLKSMKQSLGTTDFARIRIGIGKPPGSQQGRNHVLSRVGKHDRTELDIAIIEAGDAIESIATDGLETAMQRYNQRPDPA